jgi:outer membrane protein assembly factor BamB
MEQLSSLDDFSVEMGEYELVKTKKFDRLVNITTGGSVDMRPLLYKGRVYFASMNHNLYCADANTGELIWKYKTEDRIGVVAAPMISNNVVYIGSYDQNMYALDADTGDLIWKFKTRGEILCVASEKDGILYFTSRDRFLYAVTADSGELVWKFETRDEMQSSPTIFEDKLFVVSYDQNMYCVDRKTGKMIWKFWTDAEMLNAPYFTVHDRVIYFGSIDSYLYAVYIDTGKLKWKRKISNYGAMPTPWIHNNVIYESSREGLLVALDMNGNVLWQFRKNLIFGHPIVDDDNIYVTSEDQHLYCISLDGKEVWKFKTEDAVWWQPAFSEDLIYFGSYDCNLYCISKDTAELVWKFRCPGSPSVQPPLNEEYEMRLKIPDSQFKPDLKEKRYDVSVIEEEGDTNFYKSRITYQVSTQYAAKGKYQVDSAEEEF